MERMDDERYMRLALQIAGETIGQTGVNPMVGCVITKAGRIIGMGAHLQQGEDHAEIHALRMAADHAVDSTVYITLEPCCHQGRTPPCVDRLIEAKVKKVIVAAVDPNPMVSGEGLKLLREHGIEVQSGLLEKEACKLNEVFNKFIVSRRPFVTLKSASTLDGKIASFEGDSEWITGNASREYVHLLRHRNKAIMVGVNTILCDDPKLTTRLSVPALHPLRVIIDSKLRTPFHSRVVTDGEARTMILTTSHAPTDKIAYFEERGIEIICCGNKTAVDLDEAMKQLGERDISSILLEGGGRLNGAMLEKGLIDKMVLFFAPKIIGGLNAPNNFTFSGFAKMSQALQLKDMHISQFDKDVCVTGYPDYRR